MRLALRTLAFLAALGALAPTLSAAPPPVTQACEPPATMALLATPCSVSGVVTTAFQVRVHVKRGNVGAFEVEVATPGTTSRVACAVSDYAQECAPYFTFAASGPMTVTIRPLVANADDGIPWLRLEATFQ